jgi:uncharacterized membrane protein YoaK (UPF0700 family)
MSPTAERRIRDLLLDALTVSSGSVDAISFLALGKVFSAFMTGNVAFLGMRLAGAPSAGAIAILSAMAGFTLGVFVSTRIAEPHEDAGTWPPRVTLALGISLIAHALFVGTWLVSHGEPSSATAHALLGIWGLAMGMQSAAIRALHVEGVFTTAATATIIYLAGDISDRHVTNADRRRLAAVLVSLLVGATAGSVLLMHARLYAPVLPFVITAAAVATAAIAWRKREAAKGPHDGRYIAAARQA